MKLKKALLDDLLDLQEICKRAYSQHFADHWVNNGLALHLEYQYGTKRLTAELTDSTIDYYFIQSNKENIGFIKVKMQSSTEFLDLDNCELEKIYILPAYSGKGIGKKALSKIISNVREKGKRILFLCVIDTNESAIAFYEKLGFEFHSTTRIDAPHFKEELRGMNRMVLGL